MNERTFADLYCERHGLNPDDYVRTVVRETLYPHARLLAPLVRFLWSRHFSADIEFVQSVGMLRRYREYAVESEEYAHHPENRGFWRATLNVRISSRRLRRLVRATLHANQAPGEGEPDHSVAPFGGVPGGRDGLNPGASR